MKSNKRGKLIAEILEWSGAFSPRFRKHPPPDHDDRYSVFMEVIEAELDTLPSTGERIRHLRRFINELRHKCLFRGFDPDVVPKGAGPWVRYRFIREIYHEFKKIAENLENLRQHENEPGDQKPPGEEANAPRPAVSDVADSTAPTDRAATQLGVRLLDAALILNDDNEEMAKETKKRWQDQRHTPFPEKIGFFPKHKQIPMYDADDLYHFVCELEGAKCDSYNLRQELRRMAQKSLPKSS